MISGGNQEMQRKLQGFPALGVRSDGVHRAGAKPHGMFRKTLIPLLAALRAAGLATAPAADAQRGRDRNETFQNPFQRGDSLFNQWDRPNQERMPQREVSLSEVLRNLRMKYGGQHLDARKSGGYYIIAWMTEDGRRLNLRVNAETGREE